MGRYTYNASKVTQAIDELNSALDSLKDVTTEIQAGISTINNANGSGCIEIDYSELLQLQTMAETVIDEDINTIQTKVTIIEDYENAPWYQKLFSSVGMGLSKFVEGIASGVENITDGAVSIVGFVGGIFNSEFKNSVAEYVSTDHVGDWFDNQYDSGFLSGVSKYSYFSENSTAANIFKGFGTAAPYIALSMTGVGLATETVVAGLGGIGSGTEAGINKALMNDPNMTAGDAFNRAFGEGVWQGVKNSALVYTMGKLSQGIQARNGQFIRGSADDFTKLTTGSMDEVAETAKRVIGCSDDLTAIPLDDGFRLVKTSSNGLGGDVGRIIFNGDNVIINSFDDIAGTANNFNAATRVLSQSGDEILYNTTGKVVPGLEVSEAGLNMSQLAGKSFDDIASSTVIGKSGNIFKKAGEFKNNPVGKALNASDDALAKAGNAIGKTGPVKLVGKGIDKVTSTLGKSKVLTKIANGVSNVVTKHPVASFTTASTVFALDQVDEDVINSKYREQQDQLGSVTVRPTPTLTPTPTSTSGSGPTPTSTSGSGPTPTFTSGSGPTPTSTSGSGPTPTSSSATPTPTFTSGSGPTPTSTSGSGPKPTSTSGSGPKPTSTSGSGPTPTSSSATPTPTSSSVTPTATSGSGPTPTSGNPHYKPTPTSGNSYYNPTPTVGGGGYTDDGYVGENSNLENSDLENMEVPETEDMSGSFTDVIGGNDYVNIPTSAAPITTTTTTGTKKSIIPAIAGLGAAAVAGIGTKAFLDKKEENTSEEDFDAEEWTEEDSLEIDYNDAMDEDGDYLNPSDEYAYQEGDEEISGSYEAVNSSELASMQ